MYIKNTCGVLLVVLLCCGAAAAQTQINPVSQIDWAAMTGSGAPSGSCPTTTTGSTTSSSATVTVASATGLLPNQTVTGTGIPSATTILAVNAATDTVTLSQNATATGTGVSLDFYSLGRPYTDTAAGAQYVCGAAGWVQVGPGADSSSSPIVLVTSSPYNAACDGSTDDTTAIQDCLNDSLVCAIPAAPADSVNQCNVPEGLTFNQPGQKLYVNNQILAYSGTGAEFTFSSYGDAIYDVQALLTAASGTPSVFDFPGEGTLGLLPNVVAGGQDSESNAVTFNSFEFTGSENQIVISNYIAEGIFDANYANAMVLSSVNNSQFANVGTAYINGADVTFTADLFNTPVTVGNQNPGGSVFGTGVYFEDDTIGALTLGSYAISVNGSIYTTSSVSGTASTGVLTLIGGGTYTFGAVQAKTLYSAAGTALQSCNSVTKGLTAVVSDATSPTFLGTYTSGGAVSSPVLCNGSNWVTY